MPEPAAHYALIADVARSRKLASAARQALQDTLVETVGALNRRLTRRRPNPVAARLKLHSGDEIEGLFRTPAAAMEALLELSYAAAPIPLVFGLGRGALSTRRLPPRPDVTKLDGPCFHRARRAFERGSAAGRWATAEGFGPPYDDILDAFFEATGQLRARWTGPQSTYARLARHKLQKDVARALGRSESTVSEALASARFASVQRAEEGLRLALIDFGEKTEFSPTSDE